MALHNVYLAQIRNAFTSGDYYAALLGACGLGERILNQLVLTLRDDYVNHPATVFVAGKKSIDAWDTCIKTLKAWGVFDSAVARRFATLMRHRHAAVHYRSVLDSGNARDEALETVRILSEIIEEIFAPIGARPYYFTGPIGRSYVRRAAEDEPFVKHFILPACVLVSPVYRFVLSGAGDFDVYDDSEYGVNKVPLSDDEFAQPHRSSIQIAHPI